MVAFKNTGLTFTPCKLPPEDASSAKQDVDGSQAEEPGPPNMSNAKFHSPTVAGATLKV
jgi:hypothetical protein